MARKIVLIALGVLLLVIGALAAIGGGALMALFGSNNTLSSGAQNVSTPTRALVSPAGSIQGASGAQTALGSVRLRITATPAGAGHNLFLGIGPAGAVERYLSGVSYDVATDVSVTPFHLTLARHPGTATPPPPGSQSFWVAQASGSHPTLTWTVTSGSYRVVVMNTDAAAPVAFAGGLDLTIPHSFAIGMGLLIGGIVLILIAIALIVIGVRTPPRPQSRPIPDPAAGALVSQARTPSQDRRARARGPGDLFIRSQVPVGTSSGVARVAWDRPSGDRHWLPSNHPPHRVRMVNQPDRRRAVVCGRARAGRASRTQSPVAGPPAAPLAVPP